MEYKKSYHDVSLSSTTLNISLRLPSSRIIARCMLSTVGKHLFIACSDFIYFESSKCICGGDSAVTGPECTVVYDDVVGGGGIGLTGLLFRVS